jgi:two-component system sensor histidine kinase/response regulator
MPGVARILNVDDHEIARYTRSRILAKAGFEVYDASRGEEALALVGLHEPDLILLDVHLPDINGLEVCRRLKATPERASIVVLQITASAISAPQATAALNNGADAYLTEPIDPDVLVATVKAMLRLRRAERELATANRRLDSLNRELQRSNDDLKQFAFIASHDLQEPLRTIGTFVELMKESFRDRFQPEEEQYFTYVVEAATRMRHLIDDLLVYSQVSRESGGARSFIDLGDVVKEAMEGLAESISESKACIEVGSMPTVWGEKARLVHVFQNLISNAIKYRKPDEAVEIQIDAEQQSAEEWLIKVQDNGMGINPAYWETIFIPFKRLHGREVPGTGIGLALCRRIIEAQGGRIWPESTVGKGSTFFFTLRDVGNAGSMARPGAPFA